MTNHMSNSISNGVSDLVIAVVAVVCLFCFVAFDAESMEPFFAFAALNVLQVWVDGTITTAHSFPLSRRRSQLSCLVYEIGSGKEDILECGFHLTVFLKTLQSAFASN